MRRRTSKLTLAEFAQAVKGEFLGLRLINIAEVSAALWLDRGRVVAVEAQERLPQAAGLFVADHPRRRPDRQAVFLPAEQPVGLFHPHSEQETPAVGVSQ